jgi:hypothetical protein
MIRYDLSASYRHLKQQGAWQDPLSTGSTSELLDPPLNAMLALTDIR